MSKKLFPLVTFLALPLLLLGAGCGDTPEGEEIDYEDDVKPLIEEIDEKYKVRGSCNVIDSKSTCIDYIGSIWDQPDQKELNCQGVGVYSDNTCPYTEVGGCQMGGGTFTEVVTWHYDYGGEAFTEEEVFYSAGACNALPMGKWVTPDELFLKN